MARWQVSINTVFQLVRILTLNAPEKAWFVPRHTHRGPLHTISCVSARLLIKSATTRAMPWLLPLRRYVLTVYVSCRDTKPSTLTVSPTNRLNVP